MSTNPDALRVYGNLSTLELAPVLRALDGLYPGPAVLRQGGIMSLYDQPGDLPNMVGSGKSDVTTNSETQALRYSVDHPDLRFILTVAEGLYRIVGRRSAGITHLQDLKGKRIATMPKTSSAYYLERMLHTVGLGEEDVTIVPFVAGSSKPLSAIPQALCDGDIDAATIWEPELQRAQDALGGDAIEFMDRSVYREQFSLFTTQANLQDPQMRRQIVAFTRSLIDASARIRQHPHEVWPLVARATKHELKTIERAWPHHSYPGTLMHDLLDVLVQEEVWVAGETGRIPRTRDALAPLIDSSVLEEALAV
jgi:sulfonate transport system substrate-binding protein